MTDTPHKSDQEIKNLLAGYFWTEAYHRYSPLFPEIVLTDGAKALADLCEAYWLMNHISGSNMAACKEARFQIWKLRPDGTKWLLVATDGDENPLTSLSLDVCIFPFGAFEQQECVLFVGEQEMDDGQMVRVVMLPSEY